MEPMETESTKANTDLTEEELFDKYRELVNRQLHHVMLWKAGFNMGIDYGEKVEELKAITAEVEAIEKLLPALVVAEYNLELVSSRPDIFK